MDLDSSLSSGSSRRFGSSRDDDWRRIIWALVGFAVFASVLVIPVLLFVLG